MQEFDDQILKMALEKTKKTLRAPPTLPVFTEICMAFKKSIQARQEALQPKSELHKKSDPKIVKFHVRQMLETLTKRYQENKLC
ncbi:Uncharacterised protein [Legionella beliardensis]|uniref:Uncharacterized protein n=1 Tax=Legionella beliardensis TaxID=91822 RepID=A0A378HZT5_9GAMM|nr:hypothetical protein [Legionella beliardensis]STX28447.1 Uncharacterised protein [Legionella beliardensis]